MLRKVIKNLFLGNNKHSAETKHSKSRKIKIMKNILTKENTKSLYKNTFFVGIIALTLFNLSSANAQRMMNDRERGQKERETEKDNRENKMGTNIALERGQKEIVATVNTINGNTLTVTETFKNENARFATTTKTYTVDATNAKIVKNGATTSISSIIVGDKVNIVGVINGTNITAKIIRTGVQKMMENEMMGDGKPVVEGKITLINGNTITITNKSNIVYTIDATNAKIFVNNASGTISSLQTNSEIVVQGTVNGTNITATSIMIHQNKENMPETKPGFFQRTKGFFKRMFGF